MYHRLALTATARTHRESLIPFRAAAVSIAFLSSGRQRKLTFAVSVSPGGFGGRPIVSFFTRAQVLKFIATGQVFHDAEKPIAGSLDDVL
jgi:hypothetical protein